MNRLSVMPCTRCGAVPEWSPAFIETTSRDQPYVCDDCESGRKPWDGMVTEAAEPEEPGEWLAVEVPY